MNLSIEQETGTALRSLSQLARVRTEKWAAENLYCPACKNDCLSPFANNRAVEDFFCGDCERRFQLKSKRGNIGGSITNSAYSKKMAAFERNEIPSYFFLSYWETHVRNLFLVPGFFVTPSILTPRRPLSPTARRAGWVGSVMHLSRLPPNARLAIVVEGVERPTPQVRQAWKEISFVEAKEPESRSWLADVLAAIQELPASTFHLSELYERREDFVTRHPRNRNIEAKIRQQIQVLRDKGLLSPLGQGLYRRE